MTKFICLVFFREIAEFLMPLCDLLDTRDNTVPCESSALFSHARSSAHASVRASN